MQQEELKQQIQLSGPAKQSSGSKFLLNSINAALEISEFSKDGARVDLNHAISTDCKAGLMSSCDEKIY